ncbi:MAG: alpha-E domain-containing protein [Pseudomonadota bacterium]
MTLLARTAENLFWMARYVERAENTARLLYATSRISQMASVHPEEANDWETALRGAACDQLFFALHGNATPEAVIAFLAFSDDNPSSIRNCLRRARQNARSVRTALTSDTWEAINGSWLELKRIDTHDFSPRGINRFIAWVKESSLRIDGSAMRTMLRSDRYWFTRLGLYVERADTTARMLEIKSPLLVPRAERVGGSLDYYQWTALLRAVSAHSAYHWVYRQQLRPDNIADLLILREEMPRSLASCYANISDYLEEIALAYGRQGPAQRQARKTIGRLRNARISDILTEGLAEFAQEFIAENNRLGAAITEQYLS